MKKITKDRAKLNIGRRLKMMVEFDVDPPVRAKPGVYDRSQPTGMAVASNPLRDKGGFPLGGKREPGTRKLIRGT